MTADHAGQTGGEREVCGCGAGGNEPSSEHSSWCPLTRQPGSFDDMAATINRAVCIVTAAGYQPTEFLPVHPRHLLSSPSVPPARHNHVRFSNDGGPWSPCPDDCPARDSNQPHVQSAARNLTSRPGMSSELDSGRDEAPIDSPLIAVQDATGDQRGRDEAREAVARALDTCDVLDRVSDADERTGVPMARQAAAIRRAAVETIRRALLRDGTTT